MWDGSRRVYTIATVVVQSTIELWQVSHGCTSGNPISVCWFKSWCIKHNESWGQMCRVTPSELAVPKITQVAHISRMPNSSGVTWHKAQTENYLSKNFPWYPLGFMGKKGKMPTGVNFFHLICFCLQALGIAPYHVRWALCVFVTLLSCEITHY